MNWYFQVWRRFAEFGGRSRRLEFWVFQLINFLILMALAGVYAAVSPLGRPRDLDAPAELETGAGLIVRAIMSVYILASIIPNLAVTVRRLHDTNHSGWWILIRLVPCIGDVILLVFLFRDGDRAANRFGPNPKSRSSEEGWPTPSTGITTRPGEVCNICGFRLVGNDRDIGICKVCQKRM